jgi:hypothetical protein
MRRNERIRRLNEIWLEYLVAKSATDLLEANLRIDPQFGKVLGWKRRDATRWRKNLEGTLLIRIQAEFESGLREAWERDYEQSSQPRMRDLLIAISARTGMPTIWHEQADEVRIYRNAILHEGGEDAPFVPLAEVRTRLVRYTSRLPADW